MYLPTIASHAPILKIEVKSWYCCNTVQESSINWNISFQRWTERIYHDVGVEVEGSVASSLNLVTVRSLHCSRDAENQTLRLVQDLYCSTTAVRRLLVACSRSRDGSRTMNPGAVHQSIEHETSQVSENMKIQSHTKHVWPRETVEYMEPMTRTCDLCLHQTCMVQRKR